MTKTIIIDFILFIIFSFLLYSFFVPYLKKIKFGQSIRSDGPKTHLKKDGTPTMGGIVILICFFIFLSLLIVEYHNLVEINYKEVLLVIIPVLSFGMIGFIDDYLIVKLHKNKGLSALWKFMLQLGVSACIYFMYLSFGYNNSINFFGYSIDIYFGYGILLVFLLVGVTNATNLTDGVDGLLTGCSIISFVSFGIIGIAKENYTAVLFSIAFIIPLLGFLIFNLPKARLFMGNIGSLIIGAGLVAESIILKMEILLLFIGFTYFLETISVILQVWFFKKTKGKRLFLMSPIHHHLELSGFSELEIDLTLYVITIVMATIGIYLGIKVF